MKKNAGKYWGYWPIRITCFLLNPIMRLLGLHLYWLYGAWMFEIWVIDTACDKDTDPRPRMRRIL